MSATEAHAEKKKWADQNEEDAPDVEQDKDDDDDADEEKSAVDAGEEKAVAKARSSERPVIRAPEGLKTHESVYIVQTVDPLATVEEVRKFISVRVTSIRTVLRYNTTAQGKVIPGSFVVALLPIDAKKIQQQIDAANKSSKSQQFRTIFQSIEPLGLDPKFDWPYVAKQYSNSFFIRVPKRMQAKAVKKHVEMLIDGLRGKDLLEPSQVEVEVPLLPNKHHTGKCVVWVQTRQAAEYRMGKNPNLQLKLGGLADEGNLPFVRFLLNDSEWPDNMPLLNNDPDPASKTGEQLEPSYVISCLWNRRPPKRN